MLDCVSENSFCILNIDLGSEFQTDKVCKIAIFKDFVFEVLSQILKRVNSMYRLEFLSIRNLVPGETNNVLIG